MQDHDHRYMASAVGKWYSSVNEEKMTVIVSFYNDEEEEEEHELPIKYEVCPTCDGKGSHVNPDIDSHGISAEEFSEDPDFREDYFSGVYDVACYECKGRRVSPVIDVGRLTDDQKKIVKRVEDSRRDDYDYARMCAAERAMGA